jgi:L-asparaginase
MKIQIFVTGGTFDKTYNYINGKLFFEKTHIPEMLERAQCKLDIDVKQLMLIDSLEMNENQLKMIQKACLKCESRLILITHGTDRMTNTANHLIKANIKDKVIVITGAMIPYAFGSSSDGFFNLGSALSVIQNLNEGVYINMHGQTFRGDKVKKDIENGVFRSID